MDIVPILSTIILIATVITLIVAISSYMVFRIKEKRREARVLASMGNRPNVEDKNPIEDTHSDESMIGEPLHDDREYGERRQIQNAEEKPGGVERRRDNRHDDQVVGSFEADARVADRRMQEQPEMIPLPGDNRRMMERRAEQIAYDRYMESRNMISPEHFTESQARTPALQDAEYPESEDEVELSEAQAVFMDALNLSKEDVELPGKRKKNGGKHSFEANNFSTNGTGKLRRFTVPGGDTNKKRVPELSYEKVEWK